MAPLGRTTIPITSVLNGLTRKPFPFTVSTRSLSPTIPYKRLMSTQKIDPNLIYVPCPSSGANLLRDKVYKHKGNRLSCK